MHETEDKYAARHAARASGLSTGGLRLVSSSSRLVWHAPDANAAITVTRPGTKTLDQVAHETRAIGAFADAGVRTPRLLNGPIRVPGRRFAFLTEWVDNAPPPSRERAWTLMAEQASLVAGAATEGIQPVHMPAVAQSTWRELMGPDEGERFSVRWDDARSAIANQMDSGQRVVAHDDLHPGNALIDASGRCWLVDLEYACIAPPEWDLAALLVLHRRFGDPRNLDALLTYWPSHDPERLAACVTAREILVVGRLLLMRTPNAIDEGKRRARGLFGDGPPWRHLPQEPQHRPGHDDVPSSSASPDVHSALSPQLHSHPHAVPGSNR
ncbi:phosphotransferase [Streptomyces sp. NPDC005525]|uniref:phosphotransferase n=1 Tax=Streptomyces sp. NPDC005525 TaxID=3364720 RepID=UPI0036947404